MKAKGYFLVSQLKQLQGRVFERILQQRGITGFNEAQGKILAALWREDRLSMIEVSKRTGLAKTTLTSMLDRLVKQGLLERQVDEKDKRVIRMVLTEQARSLQRSYEEALDEMEEVYYQGLSAKQRASFEKRLRKIIKNLQKNE